MHVAGGEPCAPVDRLAARALQLVGARQRGERRVAGREVEGVAAEPAFGQVGGEQAESGEPRLHARLARQQAEGGVPAAVGRDQVLEAGHHAAAFGEQRLAGRRRAPAARRPSGDWRRCRRHAARDSRRAARRHRRRAGARRRAARRRAVRRRGDAGIPRWPGSGSRRRRRWPRRCACRPAAQALPARPHPSNSTAGGSAAAAVCASASAARSRRVGQVGDLGGRQDPLSHESGLFQTRDNPHR